MTTCSTAALALASSLLLALTPSSSSASSPFATLRRLISNAHRVPKPSCTSWPTIWQILRQHGRIAIPSERRHTPVERPEPLTAWQLDFKDVSTVPPETGGKQQHVVEVLNTVDTGTSILLNAQVREDFTAETTLEAIVETLREQGRPETITLDRDPRFVGSQMREFPSPLVRLLHCLGIQVTICPPRRPDRNGFVERYNRTFEYECLRVFQPKDAEQREH